MSKVWFITEAGRGISGNSAPADLAAGNAVIATCITKETHRLLPGGKLVLPEIFVHEWRYQTGLHHDYQRFIDQM
ncbi:MAG: hypothetical protein WAM09_01660 [Anaerolineales bacterium]|jgi:hypothetical protein